MKCQNNFIKNSTSHAQYAHKTNNTHLLIKVIQLRIWNSPDISDTEFWIIYNQFVKPYPPNSKTHFNTEKKSKIRYLSRGIFFSRLITGILRCVSKNCCRMQEVAKQSKNLRGQKCI